MITVPSAFKLATGLSGAKTSCPALISTALDLFPAASSIIILPVLLASKAGEMVILNLPLASTVPVAITTPVES